MNFWYIYSFLSFISLTLLLLSFFHNSIINLLLNIVFILFLQSINGLLIGINIFSLYLIIIYLGAIVILFSFMILFINISENPKSTGLIKISFFFFFFHIILVIWVRLNKGYHENYLLSIASLKIESSYQFPVIKLISKNLYNEYFYAGLICITLMSLGLFLILIFKIFNYFKEKC
uniref:NADH dehydrogenase subunit 6 n=1 Tax=Abylopsis tetragona TaxID=316209 RepID=UPI0026E14CCA|nr:NADH dehydrogenase subunit 6 [Abylopsis tetragona]WJJ69893.1 NADH dehydrogenase subunit 6 [Abylopsis tetragona]